MASKFEAKNFRCICMSNDDRMFQRDLKSKLNLQSLPAFIQCHPAFSFNNFTSLFTDDVL